MMRLLIISFLFFSFLPHIYGQKERKIVRKGVEEYTDGKFPEAEVQFRKSLDIKPGLFEAEYDIANTLYKQKKFDEAAKEYEKLIEKKPDAEHLADLYHNLGNSELMTQQFEKSVDAYKNALRIRPEDEDTRYNLAYALQKIQEQQQQKQNDKNKDQQKKDEDKKDQQNQDQKKEDKQDKQNQDKQEQQQNEQDQNKQEQQKEDQKQSMEKQDMEQILNAVQNQEKEVKEKVDKKKAVARPVATDKNW